MARNRIFQILTILALALFSASIAGAQAHPGFAPYATAGVSTSSNFGLSNPDYSVGVGIESSTRRLLLDASVTFSTSNPSALTISGIKSGSGYVTAERGAAYLKFGAILIGGGVNASLQPSALVSIAQAGSVTQFLYQVRSAVHPFVGAGIQAGRLRLLADYNLPGIDALPNERAFDLNAEVRISKHLRLTGSATLNSYFNGAMPAAGVNSIPVPYTQGNVRVAGTKLGIGAKFVL